MGMDNEGTMFDGGGTGTEVTADMRGTGAYSVSCVVYLL
jgi:hypothetical protein